MPKYRVVSRLARAFGIRVRKSVRIKPGVYRIQLTNGKQYALKFMPRTSMSHIRWIDRALQRIRKNGFPRISWRNPQEPEGKKLVVRLKGKPTYVMNPWIRGRLPSIASNKDMRICGAALARFHKAGCAMHIPRRGAMYMLSQWPSELRKKHRGLIRNIAKARRNEFSPALNRFLQKHGNELLGYSRQARMLLRRSGYQAACRKARNRPTLCHGDAGPTNFILTKKGTHLIDFETLRIDLRAYDLYRLIYNACHVYGWQFRIARSLLDGYQSVSKLSRAELKLVKAWLRYPRTTDLLLFKYNYFGRRVKANVVRKLPAAIAAERKVTSFLRKLDRYR